MFMEKPPKRFLKAKCHTFVEHHENEDTYRELLQIKRSFRKLHSDLFHSTIIHDVKGQDGRF
ncbi:hypothetical protein Bca101_011145 [Brassica carinata]